jgi:hypothetical protein
LKARVYKACKAYGNHWRAMSSLGSLVDCDSSGFKTFDSGMACTFMEKRINRAGGTIDEAIQYVGVLTDILVLDYGALRKDVVLFKGRWADPSWTPRATASMKYDESGLWQANFQKELGSSKKMDYVFPQQVEQVFFYPNEKGTAWRTILHKESRSTRVTGDVLGVDFHDTMENNAKHHIQLAEDCRTRLQPRVQPGLQPSTNVAPRRTGKSRRA